MTSSNNHLQIERLQRVINEILIREAISQRELSRRIDITIGTMTKYLRGEVNPYDIKTRITINLARELKVTPDSLYEFFATGEYKSTTNIEAVESWIRSSAGQEDLPRILSSLAYSQNKALQSASVDIESINNEKKVVKASKAPRKPTAAEFKKCGELSAQHFEDIQREEVLSAKKTWQLFLEQENSKLIKDEHLTAILDVFRGEEVFTLEAMKSIGFEYGRCPVLTAFRTMSDLPIKKEHAQLVHDCELYIAHLATKQNIAFEVQPVDG
jgi:transcriptional regulator with XRE-family HTH domain